MSTTTTLAPLPHDRLEQALRSADLRVLLMSLVQLTGDRRWLAEPYRPSRDNRLVADEHAGFDDDVADEIRAAAFDAITTRTEAAIDDPGDELMLEMMRWCVQDDVDPGYAPMMRENLGVVDRDAGWSDGAVPAAASQRHVAVVGAGASGLILGARLRRLGIPFTILERSDEVGGTWRDNTYPGCGVDTPNHAYSFSLGEGYPWSRNFSPQPEVLDYLRKSVDEFGLHDHLRMRTTVTGARWDADTRRWQIAVSGVDGPGTVEATDLVVAIGQFGVPSIPHIPGDDQFTGPMFHTTEWPADLDVSGKRVAVIGTGASAMQIVPTIAPDVARVTVFQRTPQWARPIPRYQDAISDDQQWLLSNVPFYRRWFRFTMIWRYGDGLLPFLYKDPTWPHPERSLNRVNEKHRQEMVDHMVAELGDRTDLLDRCVPSYPPYGKRILLDNGWYRALRRPNVELVTEPIERITPSGIVTAAPGGDDGAAGVEREFDVIVLSTGFRMTDMARVIAPVGRDGITLDDVWGDDDATAHLGITVPGFPNLFLMQGPSTGLGHGGSAIIQTESQARFITDAVRTMVERGIASIEPTPEAHDAFVAEVDGRHADMIWTHPGTETYYRNSHGRVVSVTPFSLLEYWQMTHDIDLDDYVVDDAGT